LDSLAIKRARLDSLHLDPANARAHGDASLAAVEASMTRFGQAEPNVVQASSGRVIAGNGRLVGPSSPRPGRGAAPGLEVLSQETGSFVVRLGDEHLADIIDTVELSASILDRSR
jgi:hypothetical protein